MGASQSRGKRTISSNSSTNVKRKKSLKRQKSMRGDAGYFLVKFKKKQIKVVNAEAMELRSIEKIVRNHVTIMKEEWDRKLSFSMTTSDHNMETRTAMLAEVLLCLHQLGWVPLAPLGSGTINHHQDHHQQHHHTAVCFKRQDTCASPRVASISASTLSLPQSPDLSLSSATCQTCLCLQRCGQYLVFRGCPHPVLHSLVTNLHQRGAVAGVSLSVASIISDYTVHMPPVLNTCPASISTCQVLLLSSTSTCVYDDVMSCLAKEGYSLTLDLDISMDNTIYFFVKDRTTIRPGIKRLKSVKQKNNKPSRVVSLRRKAVTRQFSTGSTKGRGETRESRGPGKLAWWQQASTDTSEWETEAEDDELDDHRN